MVLDVSAIVVRAPGAKPALERIRLPEAGPGQVRVRIRAAGVCHSDLSMLDGTLDVPYPLILGHEAAGEVLASGADHVRPGDLVTLNWQPPCRRCWFCTHGEPWLCAASYGSVASANGATCDGEPAHAALGLGAFAEQVVVPAGAVVPVPPDLDPVDAALLGCAVLTGTGAVRRTARVRPGETVVVLGLGGVGLAVVAAARSAGAAAVIGVDVVAAKEAAARAAGATDFVTAGDVLSKEIRSRTDGVGADHVFECVGRAATIRAAWRATRRGGQVTVVGMGGAGDVVQFSALDVFTSARTLRSSVYGSSDPAVEIPALAAEVRAGRLPLAPLVSDRITLDGVPAAFERMARGEGARSVVVG